MFCLNLNFNKYNIMKKLILGLSTLVVLFSSCSTNDDTTTVPEVPITSVILAKKIITTDVALDAYVITSDLTFNGSKIAEKNVVSTDPATLASKEVYTYTGDLITKIETFTAGVSSETQSYTYDSNNVLSSALTIKAGKTSETKIVYVPNTDGTVNYTESSIVITTNLETIGNKGKLSFVNGDLVKKEILNDKTSTGGSLVTTLITFEYDTANSTNKNILGFDKLYLTSLNNTVKRTTLTTTTPFGGTTTSVTSVTTNGFLYNSSNFPTQRTASIDGAISSTSQILY